jgi:hypothetical protein
LDWDNDSKKAEGIMSVVHILGLIIVILAFIFFLKESIIIINAKPKSSINLSSYYDTIPQGGGTIKG